MSRKVHLMLLLAASVASFVLSGCSQTIQQHHFLTDSYNSNADMEYVTQYIETNALPALQELKTFCDSKGIKLGLIQIMIDPRSSNDGAPMPFTPPEEQIENFFNPEASRDTYLRSYSVIDKSDSIVSFINELNRCIAELHRVLEENEENLNALIDAEMKESGQLTFELSGYLIWEIVDSEEDIQNSTFYAFAELEK